MEEEKEEEKKEEDEKREDEKQEEEDQEADQEERPLEKEETCEKWMDIRLPPAPWTPHLAPIWPIAELTVQRRQQHHALPYHPRRNHRALHPYYPCCHRTNCHRPGTARDGKGQGAKDYAV